MEEGVEEAEVQPDGEEHHGEEEVIHQVPILTLKHN
jgi:hypothetical protein